MKHALVPLFVALMLSPAMAQDPLPEAPDATPPGDVEQGVDLLEEGAKLLLRGLMAQMEPTLDDMGQTLSDLEPALRELIDMIGDFRNYEAPEKLPNGDILIRRKPPELPVMPDGEIEL